MDFYRAVSNKNMIVRSMTETNRKALGFDTTKLTSGKLNRAPTQQQNNALNSIYKMLMWKGDNHNDSMLV